MHVARTAALVTFALTLAAAPSGAQTSPAAAPGWTAESDSANTAFGRATANAGDVNGDGIDDMLVGAHHLSTIAAGNAFNGGAFLYLGSQQFGGTATPAWSVLGTAFGEQVGVSVACAGDVNGDGFLDVAIGATGGQLTSLYNEGYVKVYLGSPTGLSGSAAWTGFNTAQQSNFLYGWSVAGAGDVNGDGFSDLVVGIPQWSNGGAAVVHHGSAAGLGASPAWVAFGSDTHAGGFGSSVSSAGDVNADGYSDILIGAPSTTATKFAEGRAYLYRGSAATVSALPVWFCEGNQITAILGSSVAAPGDLNLDGFDDIVVGVPQYTKNETQEGAVFLFTGPNPTYFPKQVLELDQAGASLGYSTARCGDVNSDGVPDVLAGAPNFTDGEASEGYAAVFAGLGAGPGPQLAAAQPFWTAGSNEAGAQLGTAVAAGDVDGNGLVDVWAGAPESSAGQLNEGRVLLYFGSCATVASATNYGTGKPGTNGIPTLTSSLPPKLGSATDLTIGNGLAGAGPLLLVMGLAPAVAPFDGGSLLVAPAATVLLPGLDGSGGLVLPLGLPKGPHTLCGTHVYWQALFVDPSASGSFHTAQTPGLEWVIGN